MASQTEIARLTGVSQSVVSRVLNGRAAEFGIPPETVTRITATATNLDYRPNAAARMLLGGASKLVGVVVRSFDDPFLAAILQELNRRALAAGYTLLVIGLEGDDDQRAREVKLVQHYRPDALIVVGTTNYQPWGDELFPRGKPVVQIGLPSSDPRVTACGIDETAAATDLVRHLLDAGHRRIGLVGDNTAASLTRVQLLRAALHELAGPAALAGDYLSPLEGADAGADAVKFFLAQPVGEIRTTALIVTGDLIALGLIKALRENGIVVPASLAVASYDDVPVAALTRPSLTTIRQPARDLAAAAMAIVTGDAPPAPVRLRGELIIRESSGA